MKLVKDISMNSLRSSYCVAQLNSDGEIHKVITLVNGKIASQPISPVYMKNVVRLSKINAEILLGIVQRNSTLSTIMVNHCDLPTTVVSYENMTFMV